MVSLFKRSRSRSRLGPTTTSKKYSAMRKAGEIRFVKEGFPRETPFSSTSEVAEYFSTETIQCLRCGHSFKNLPRHLKVHEGWHPDRYRDFYQLPKTRGLIGAGLRRHYAQASDHLTPYKFKKGNTPTMKTGTLPKYRRVEFGKLVKIRWEKDTAHTERVEKIVRLRKEGKSMKEIGTEMGMTWRAVSSVLYKVRKKAAATIRTQ